MRPALLLVAAALALVGTPAAAAETGAPSPAPVSRAALGVLFATGNPGGLQKPGVPVEAVFPKGPAEQAGLASGDVILRVADVGVDNQTTLSKEIHKYHVGSQIPLLYLRNGTQSRAVVTLADEGSMYADAEAQTTLRHAADRGEAWAQSYLGAMYANGQGVARDGAQAVSWYRKAAEQGHAGAQFKLGVIYEEGRGVAKDEAQAAKWYRMSAEQGYDYAQFNLGAMYEQGQGVAKDEAEALTWYRRAAEQGNGYALASLGSMYHDGRGTAEDDVTAYMWCLLAAASSQRDVQRTMNAIKLTDGQLAEAKRRAAAWTVYLHRTDDPEAPARAAEQAGRAQEAFQGYLAALRELPDPPPVEVDRRIRERIIHLALQLDPPPAIPDEAKHRADDAAAAVSGAGSSDGPAGSGDALTAWKESLLLAPWWADAYYHYAAALEQQGDYEKAARNLKLYLLAAPDAKDAMAVQQKTLELENKVKRQGG
ncbi:MAG TPA: PDZ domain-containing protein [Nitrospiria bacterium]|nr:PDZ domain-containing protein [Nitrospiria bacterium]